MTCKECGGSGRSWWKEAGLFSKCQSCKIEAIRYPALRIALRGFHVDQEGGLKEIQSQWVGCEFFETKDDGSIFTLVDISFPEFTQENDRGSIVEMEIKKFENERDCSFSVSMRANYVIEFSAGITVVFRAGKLIEVDL